ncbi:MAG: hypothetical protein HQK99_04330 [Nitrospirae bacterium]|nr:hypothetical protein [Nitrospirota bacterium]
MPNREFKVRERLLRAKIEAFLSTAIKLSRWKDGEKLMEFPLSPYYLFVRIRANSEDKGFVLRTPGVIRFVGAKNSNGYGYESVPHRQITYLKIISESKEAVNSYPFMIEGQKVRVTKGPFVGVDGLLN